MVSAAVGEWAGGTCCCGHSLLYCVDLTCHRTGKFETPADMQAGQGEQQAKLEKLPAKSVCTHECRLLLPAPTTTRPSLAKGGCRICRVPPRATHLPPRASTCATPYARRPDPSSRGPRPVVRRLWDVYHERLAGTPGAPRVCTGANCLSQKGFFTLDFFDFARSADVFGRLA